MFLASMNEAVNFGGYQVTWKLLTETLENSLQFLTHCIWPVVTEPHDFKERPQDHVAAFCLPPQGFQDVTLQHFACELVWNQEKDEVRMCKYSAVHDKCQMSFQPVFVGSLMLINHVLPIFLLILLYISPCYDDHII